MSICIVAMVVLAVMSIFSAKYRSWAREAFDCVLRRLTIRPCNTGFNEKMRAKITSTLMKRHMGFAKFTHKHFEAISWIFTIIMFVSIAYMSFALYNLVVFGTCDPVSGECVFNPGGDPNRVVCPWEDLEPENSVETIGGFMNIQSAVISNDPDVYFFGTTWCPHCAWEKPIFNRVAAKFQDYADIHLIEIDLEEHTYEEIKLFNHYSNEGYIPLLIFDGKYYRIGAGESIGESIEEDILTALFCKVTDSPIDECDDSEIQNLVAEL